MANAKSQQNNQDNIDPGTLQNMVAECAYLKAEARGFAPGYEMDDWLEAEQELINQNGFVPQQAE